MFELVTRKILFRYQISSCQQVLYYIAIKIESDFPSILSGIYSGDKTLNSGDLKRWENFY
jgi:hypothetical protein